jgi:hypothetical protein
MNTNLNFVFLKDTFDYNGDDSYSHQGPIFNYIQEKGYSYTTHGKLNPLKKNLLLIESNHKFESLLYIPQNIFDFIQTNDIKLLFTSIPDPCNEATFKLGYEFIQTKLPKEKYHLIDSNTSLPNIFTFDFFLEQATWHKAENFNGVMNSLGYISEEINETELDTFRPKKFLCFNRNTDKPHRISLLYEYLTNDYSDSYFTFLMQTEGFSEIYGKKPLLGNSVYSGSDFFNKRLPIELDTQTAEDKSNFNIGGTFKKELFLNSCINLVTETSFELNELFISEKVFKPIINYQPFIVFGPYRYLEKLRSYGYKTFGDFWDESYDNIEDPKMRFFALLEIVRELNSKTIEELNDIYKNLKHICIYNKQLFDSMKIDNLDKILKKIQDEW